MNTKTDDKSCQICVCSVEGKNEYCSTRPAKNVNECIRMAALIDKFKRNHPYEHEQSLSFRIRRGWCEAAGWSLRVQGVRIWETVYCEIRQYASVIRF